MRILIADDSAIIRRGVKNLLSTETAWIVCGEATDGRATIEKARALNPDLVLLDASLPDINGLEVAKHLRAEMPDVKILIISQHDPVQLLQSALAAGADACVDKGCVGAELLATIKRII